MNEMKREADRTLRIRLRATITAWTVPSFPEELDWRLQHHFLSNESEKCLGKLPTPLQHLCLLALTLEKENSDECHRRCVEIFGREEYDNERMEYDVYCEVGEDPRFNQAAKVWRMLDTRVRRFWPQLLTSEGHRVIFFVDTTFMVHETNLREKSEAEIFTDLQAGIGALAGI